MNAYLQSAQDTLPQLPDGPVAICQRLAGYDFPWELNRSFEVAILKTFCVPRISHLLHQTGKFKSRPQQRYDDTSLILGNILKWGYDSPRGRAAIAQMNRIHQRFGISNDDFLYVLSTLIYEPVRWNQYFGWRPFTPSEKLAMFEFWRVVGERMGLQDIPETYAAFEQFNQDFETRHFVYDPDNAAVGNAVLALLQSWFPAIAAPLIAAAVKTIASDAMCLAMGWQKPHPALRRWVLGALHLKQRVTRWLPKRNRPSYLVDKANKTYPNGYEIEQLGTESAERPSRCPFLQMRSMLKGKF